MQTRPATHNDLTASRQPGPMPGQPRTARGAPAARLAAGLIRWSEMRRQRHALAALDDHLLRDIGLL